MSNSKNKLQREMNAILNDDKFKEEILDNMLSNPETKKRSELLTSSLEKLGAGDLSQAMTNKLLVSMALNQEQFLSSVVGQLASVMPKEYDPVQRATASATVLKKLEGILYNIETRGEYDFLQGYAFMTDEERSDIIKLGSAPALSPPEASKSFMGDPIHGHDQDKCVEHLYRMNNIPFQVCSVVIDQEETHRKYDKLSKIEKKNFHFISQERGNILHHLKGQVVFVKHKPDKRGRTYSDNKWYSYQSHDYLKNALELSEKKIITKKNSFWIKIAIANMYDQDKESFKDRVKFFNTLKATSFSIEPPVKQKHQARAAIQAWYDYENGIPSGYQVGLDAGASGAQILSCLCKDYQASLNCGLTGQKRVDLYSVQLVKINEFMDGVTRKQIKYSTMPKFYGSSAAPKRLFKNTLALKNYNTVFNFTLPKVTKLMDTMAKWGRVKTERYNVITPDGFTGSWLKKNKDMATIKVDGLRPFVYKYKDWGNPKCNDISIQANITHMCDGWVVREVVRLLSPVTRLDLLNASVMIGKETPEQNNPIDFIYKEQAIPSLGMLEGNYKKHLATVDPKTALALQEEVQFMLSLRTCHVVTIHDEFRVLPEYAMDLRKAYNYVMYKLCKGTFLQYLYRAIANNYRHKDTRDILMEQEILKSHYSIS